MQAEKFKMASKMDYLSSISKGPFCLDMMFISGINTKVVM